MAQEEVPKRELVPLKLLPFATFIAHDDVIEYVDPVNKVVPNPWPPGAQDALIELLAHDDVNENEAVSAILALIDISDINATSATVAELAKLDFKA